MIHESPSKAWIDLDVLYVDATLLCSGGFGREKELQIIRHSATVAFCTVAF